jgi:rhodopsin domain-containing protein
MEAPPADPNAPLHGAAAHVDKTGLLVIVWVTFSIATSFVFLRLTVRWRQNSSILPDDYWMVFAWLCLLTMAILQTEQMSSLWYITYLMAGRIPLTEEVGPQTEQLTRWQFPVIKLFWTVLWTVKASFMALFFRLVKPFVVLRRLWYCVAVFAVLAYIGCWLSSALTCDPPSDYFKAGKSLPSATGHGCAARRSRLIRR